MGFRARLPKECWALSESHLIWIIRFGSFQYEVPLVEQMQLKNIRNTTQAELDNALDFSFNERSFCYNERKFFFLSPRVTRIFFFLSFPASPCIVSWCEVFPILCLLEEQKKALPALSNFYFMIGISFNQGFRFLFVFMACAHTQRNEIAFELSLHFRLVGGHIVWLRRFEKFPAYGQGVPLIASSGCKRACAWSLHFGEV